MLVWDATATSWRDDTTGLAAIASAVIGARDALADDYALRFRELAALFASGTVSVGEWHALFSALLLESITHGYTFGRGGIDLMTASDWEAVATSLETQTEYADAFVAEVEQRIEQRVTEIVTGQDAAVTEPTAVPDTEAPTPDPTPDPPPTTEAATVIAQAEAEDAVAARSELYAGTVVHSFEVAQVEAIAVVRGRGLRDLPYFPADGGTQCRSNCRCSWTIAYDDIDRIYRCTWNTEGDGKVCAGCAERRRLANPLLIPYATDGGNA